jgi:hypothetical protein
VLRGSIVVNQQRIVGDDKWLDAVAHCANRAKPTRALLGFSDCSYGSA